jgi:hypothetical protein
MLICREDFIRFKNSIPYYVKEVPVIKYQLDVDERRAADGYDVFLVQYTDLMPKLIDSKLYKEAVEFALAIYRNFGFVSQPTYYIWQTPEKEILNPYIEYLVENINAESEEDEMLSVLNDYFFSKYYDAIGCDGIIVDISEDSSYFRYKLKIHGKENPGLAKFAKKVTDEILSKFPSPSDDFKKKNEFELKRMIYICLLENDVEKAEEISDKYIVGDSDKYKLKSAIIWGYINKKRYEKAISLARWVLDNCVIPQESPNTEKREKFFYIKLLEMNKSYDEAEIEYRELGELQKAGEMYERAGMKQKAIEIYTEIEKEKWGGIHPETEDQKSKCPNCREELEPDWEFCPSCMTGLKKRICSSCGRELKPHWKMCPKCGK